MNSSQSRTLVKTMFILLTFNYCLGAIASLVRLRFGDAAWLNLGYQRAILPVFLILSLLIATKNLKHTLDNFSIMLVVLFIYGSSWGLYNNGLNYYFIIHAFSAVFAIVIYLSGRSAIYENAAYMRENLRRMAYIVTAFHVPIMVVYVYLAASGVVYFGMSASILILTAIFFLDERRWNWASIAMLMILVSGKRGEIIGLAFAVLTWLMVRGVNAGFSNIGKYFLGLVLVIFLFIGLSLSGFGGEIAGDLGEKFKSFYKADFSDLTSSDTRAAIGGRGTELLLFNEKFIMPGLARVLAGLGFGWNVIITTVSGAEVDVLYFVHVSPLNAIGQYGLLLGGTLWIWMIGIAARGLIRAKFLGGNRVLVPYSVGMMFVSLSAFVISVDPGFWFFLGACSIGASGTGKRRIPRRHSTFLTMRRTRSHLPASPERATPAPLTPDFN